MCVHVYIGMYVCECVFEVYIHMYNAITTLLGGRVPLHGFKGFLGGLDNERNLTGELSVYSKFQDLEIMFHVATLLPFSPKDSQQVIYLWWWGCAL